MRQTRIAFSGSKLDYRQAAALAAALAGEDKEVVKPVLMAWYDRQAARMSPAIEGANLRTRWRDYGASHGGQLEVDIGDEFAFVYADSEEFAGYEASPYSNLRDAQGNEYVCQISLLRDSHTPSADACTALDEWTSKLT